LLTCSARFSDLIESHLAKPEMPDGNLFAREAAGHAQQTRTKRDICCGLKEHRQNQGPRPVQEKSRHRHIVKEIAVLCSKRTNNKINWLGFLLSSCHIEIEQIKNIC
jgi:hypothetical protein